MGKIHGVIYRKIDPEVYSPEEASQYYFYINLLDVDSRFNQEFEEYQLRQILVRNRIISEAVKEEEKVPILGSAIFGISSVNNRAIVIVDV